MRKDSNSYQPSGLPQPIGRRLFLAAGGALLAGCDLLSTEPGGEQRSGGGNGGADAKEAPSLAAQVRAGELPALEDRLPDEPVVVEPVESEGIYGGTWNTCNTSTDSASVYEKIGYEQLARWDLAQPGEVKPNLLRSWSLSDDELTYTLELVPGVKWSDGEPFTADDIVFAYSDVLQNSTLYPAFPEWLMSDGQPGVIEKVDQYTVTLTFEQPHALLPQYLAMPSSNVLCSLPSHYLQQFHEEYNDNIAELTEEEGFSDWGELFFGKGGSGVIDLGAWQNTELPTLLPWKVTQPLGESDRLVCERNPYYWKTDPQGRQLPYLDQVVIRIVSDPETVILQSSNGEYSLPTSDVMELSNKPVLARSREESQYHFITLLTGYMNERVVALNQTAQDPDLREIFQNKDFRIGLSHAINRQEIIDTVYQRQGEPWQAAPRPDSPFYDETMAKQYTEYDVDKANQYLDRAGYVERDDDGYRLGPSGKRIRFTAEFPMYGGPDDTTGELIVGYWKEVGVEMRIKADEVSLFFERTAANSHDAALYPGEYGLALAMFEPKWYMPAYYQSLFATQWGAWYATGGESGEEPPEAPRRQMELYDQVKTTVDPAEREALFVELLDITRDEFYVIGTALPVNGYNIVKNDFHNVPSEILNSWLWVIPGHAQPEQFYISEQ